jgi:hypothetical protein
MNELIEINRLETSRAGSSFRDGMAGPLNSDTIFGASSKAMPAGPNGEG